MKILITVLSVIFLSSISFAGTNGESPGNLPAGRQGGETIHFKDGRSLEGKVVQKSASEVKFDSNGMVMTYYADEIKDIDGQAMETPVAQAAPVVTKDDPVAKKALILKFIDVFGTRRAMTRNFETLMASLAQQKPEDAQKIREGFKIDEIIDRLVPLYDKHFTSEDLKTYIDFYSSSKGQKLIISITAVLQESVQVSVDYLKEKFPEMVEKQ